MRTHPRTLTRVCCSRRARIRCDGGRLSILKNHALPRASVTCAFAPPSRRLMTLGSMRRNCFLCAIALDSFILTCYLVCVEQRTVKLRRAIMARSAQCDVLFAGMSVVNRETVRMVSCFLVRLEGIESCLAHGLETLHANITLRAATGSRQTYPPPARSACAGHAIAQPRGHGARFARTPVWGHTGVANVLRLRLRRWFSCVCLIVDSQVGVLLARGESASSRVSERIAPSMFDSVLSSPLCQNIVR